MDAIVVILFATLPVIVLIGIHFHFVHKRRVLSEEHIKLKQRYTGSIFNQPDQKLESSDSSDDKKAA